MTKHVVIIPGDDAAPEAMTPTVAILKSLGLALTFARISKTSTWESKAIWDYCPLCR